ncbi:acyltransferase [Paenibacillus phocaensis]|uniref:acyltransferase n=1 Tax=Paenibacillus phocaensis TaxID=1776378 RepID=UPI000839BB5B|nr:acyltransferase [Paenibacillus phocaensis]
MSKVVKERLPQLDIFRALAIFSVIQVHASSFAAAEQALNSPVYYFYNWLNIFFKIGTPSFIFLSSFVLFYNYYDQPISRKLVRKFYKKRLTYIILPYLLVSCCYFMLLAIYRHDFINNSKMYELKSLGLALLNGTAYTHLYFVFISIQFYLLFPLFLWLFQSFRNHRALLALILPCGLALQWGFVFWNKYELQLTNKASYAITYMGYYMLGAVLAIGFGKIKVWLNTEWKALSKDQKGWTAALWGGWLLVAFLHVQLWYAYRQGLASPNSLWFELLWNVHSLFSALVLLKAAFYIQRKGSAFWIRTLTRVGELSFGIYLFHPFVLFMYRLLWSEDRLPGASIGYLIYIGIGSLGALFLSWGFVQFSFRRLPFAAWFLGNVPASLRKNKPTRPRESGQSPSVGANL